MELVQSFGESFGCLNVTLTGGIFETSNMGHEPVVFDLLHGECDRTELILEEDAQILGRLGVLDERRHALAVTWGLAAVSVCPSEISAHQGPVC